jgi:hypothetical protein
LFTWQFGIPRRSGHQWDTKSCTDTQRHKLI